MKKIKCNNVNRYRIVMQIVFTLLLTLFLFQFIACDKKEKPSKKTVSSKNVDPIVHIKKKLEVEIVQLNPSTYPDKKNRLSSIARPDHSKKYKMIPTKKPNGKKWRIGYLEGGSFYHYYNHLQVLAKGLKDLGWITYESLPSLPQKDDTKGFWTDFLSSIRVQSDTVEFVRNAFYSAEWDKKNRSQVRSTVLERLNKRKDIDLIIAMGTWAGQDLAVNEHSTPVVSMSVANPVQAKIISSPYDSGLDHLHSRTDPGRFRRRLELFYNTIKFKKLGVMYENSEYGWNYAAMDDVMAVAKKFGFEVIGCHAHEKDDITQTYAESVECMNRLSTQIDAVWITHHIGFGIRNATYYLEPLLKRKIPSFLQGDSEAVKYGALLGAERNWPAIGRYEAEIIAQIFNGAKPRELSQVFKIPQKIAINLKTAELIGFVPDESVMSKVSRTYTTIAEESDL